MSQDLHSSVIISGTQAIASYTRNGKQIGTESISEYIDFTKLSVVDTVPFIIKYPDSDLRIVSIQASNDNSDYTVSFNNENGTTYFSNNYILKVFDPAWLILPRGHVCTIMPNANVSVMRILAQQCYILNHISLI